MTDPFLAFLHDLKATHEAERDKQHKGLPQDFVRQQRAIAAAGLGVVQAVIAKYEELKGDAE